MISAHRLESYRILVIKAPTVHVHMAREELADIVQDLDALATFEAGNKALKAQLETLKAQLETLKEALVGACQVIRHQRDKDSTIPGDFGHEGRVTG